MGINFLKIEVFVLLIGLIVTSYQFIYRPMPGFVFYKDDQYYIDNPIKQINVRPSELKRIGSLAIDGGNFQGSYPLYEYTPRQYWVYSLIMTLLSSMLIYIIKEMFSLMKTKSSNGKRVLH